MSHRVLPDFMSIRTVQLTNYRGKGTYLIPVGFTPQTDAATDTLVHMSYHVVASFLWTIFSGTGLLREGLY